MRTSIETVPAVWTTEDESFFATVAHLFPTRFTAGAGTLLASYDPEVEAVDAPVQASIRAGTPVVTTA